MVGTHLDLQILISSYCSTNYFARIIFTLIQLGFILAIYFSHFILILSNAILNLTVIPSNFHSIYFPLVLTSTQSILHSIYLLNHITHSTCVHGRWECAEIPGCTDVCQVNAFGHFVTFDNTDYDFYGACEYALVSD